jgi:signal transduction histidine kinase
MKNRIKDSLKEKLELHKTLSREAIDLAQTIDELSSEIVDPIKAIDLTREVFSELGYQSSLTKPQSHNEKYIELKLGTSPKIRGKSDVGSIYLFGEISDEKVPELQHIANAAGRAIDHVERGEEWRTEIEFHKAMNNLAAHDLRSPLTNLQLYTEEIEKTLNLARIDVDVKDRLSRYELMIRNYLAPAQSAIRRVSNTAGLLVLNSINQETLSRQANEIFPLEEIISSFDASTHDAIRRNKGLSLHFREEDKSKSYKIHREALGTISNNLVDNAIKHAIPNSNIYSRIAIDKGKLTYEIENEIFDFIDIKELTSLLKKGYRPVSKSSDDLIGKNEGDGMYFINKIVRSGFGGDLIVFSDYDQRIKENKEFQIKNFTDLSYQELNERVPRFYVKIEIPLDEKTKL